MPTYRCAICQREVAFEQGLPELYPFCSERCRWVDLGRWFSGEYSLECERTDENEPDTAPPAGRDR